MGHATRCIPLIRYLLQQQTEVIVAAEGKIALILSEAFPGIRIVPLKGYRIRYSKSRAFFALNIIFQLPKILLAIRNERKWLEKLIEQEQIQAVISDNRFGLHNKKISCVFITHQLHIKTNFVFTDAIVQKLNYHFINRFRECWVPDDEGADNLAGELSHPVSMPSVPVRYLGVLSRFKKVDQLTKYTAAIILSGPEPQRTIFESVILQQLKDVAQPVVMVRGLPEENHLLKKNFPNLTVFNHLNADELSAIMQQSEIVIARSGYSTVMDLAAIQKKSVLVPTPGQTEQEYLARYLFEKKLCVSVSQKDFQLGDALAQAQSFDYKLYSKTGINESVINDWIAGLKRGA